MRRLKQSINHSLKTHGPFLALVPLAPFFPQITKIHALAYLKILQAFAFDIHYADTGITLLFGNLGKQVLDHVKATNVRLIFFSTVYHQWHTLKDYDGALVLIESILTDPSQRTHPQSHLIRQELYQHLPFMVQSAKRNRQNPATSRLISLFITNLDREQSPECKVAAKKTLTALTLEAQLRLRQIQQRHESNRLDSIRLASIRSLLPDSSIYSMISAPTPTPSETHLTSPDINLLLHSHTHQNQEPPQHPVN